MEYFTAAPQPAIMYAGNMAPTTPIYIPQPQPVYACFPVTLNTGLMSQPTPVRTIQQVPTSTVNGPVVQTEARKVIIKGLPRDTSEATLVSLIDQFSSRSSSSRSHGHRTSYSAAIQHVDLARHSDGRLKGHAFIIFETHRVAKKVVESIHGHKFQGRELRATLAKEGVEPADTFHQYQQQHVYQSPDSSRWILESPMMTHDKAEPRQEAASKEHQDSQWDGNPNGEGSSNSGKGKEGARASSSEDRGRKSRPKSREPTGGAPAVVDGSGRRHH